MKQDEKTILYIDDDPDDLELMQEVLQEIAPTYKLVKAMDGADGLEKLANLNVSSQLPCLILLDINMPKLNGREVFQRIRADEAIAHIPIVVFSTSNHASDKAFFESDNTGYLTKPLEYKLFLQAAKQLIAKCND